MRRMLVPLLLLVVVAPLGAGRAKAGETWCADDPVVSVGGRLLDIQVQMPVDNVLTMRSTALTVVIPQNLAGSVVVDDISAFPMHTTVSPTGPAWAGSGPVPITIQVQVAAATAFPVRVVATPLLNLTTPLASTTSAVGEANALLTVPMTLGQ
jgi:hypothetical protein